MPFDPLSIAYVKEHGLDPAAEKFSQAPIKALEKIEKMLGDPPNPEQIELLLQKHHRLLDATRSANAEGVESHLRLIRQHNVRNLEEQKERLVEEIGPVRSEDILRGSPVMKTRDALIQITMARYQVLLNQKPHVFFADKIENAIVANDIKWENSKKASLQEDGFEGDVLERMLGDAKQYRQDGLKTMQINDGIQVLQKNLADLTVEQAAKIMDQARNGFLTIEQLQVNSLTDLRQSLIAQADQIIREGKANTNRLIEDGEANANRLIEDREANTQKLIKLTEEQGNIVRQALHAEVDRAILAGEHGLNNFLTLTREDQGKLLVDIHQHLDKNLAKTIAAQGKSKTMSFNDNPNETISSISKRFFADAIRNGVTKTARNRAGKWVEKYIIHDTNRPQIAQQASSFTQRAIANVASNSNAGQRLLKDS